MASPLLTLTLTLTLTLARTLTLTKAWHLLFSSALHGRSLAHLLHLAAPAGPVLLLIRDRAGHLFGAFLSELREPHATATSAATAATAVHAAHVAGAGFYGAGEI